MYLAKYYAIKNGVKFDEIAWLEENGHGDLAKRYMPFSEKREKEIITLAGVKYQAEQARKSNEQKCVSDTREAVAGRDNNKNIEGVNR